MDANKRSVRCLPVEGKPASKQRAGRSCDYDAVFYSRLLAFIRDPTFILHANRRANGSPSARRNGRFVWSWTSVRGLMPKRQRIVAVRSPGLTGSIAG